MSIYSRARRHINMERVKELKEEKYIKKLERQQEIVLAEISKLEKERKKHFDWRTGKGLTEQMTTDAIGLTTLPAEGDVDLENITKTATPGSDGSGGSGGSYSFGSYDETGNGGFSIVLDTRKYDTLKFTAGSGNATRIEVSIDGGDFQTLSSGTNTITISSANRTSSTRFIFNAFKSGGSGSTGASISGTVFQRRLPVNAFLGLDDPDSSAFVRDGQTDNLSPGEKKKKLEKQLRSSKEYLNKMFGEGMPKTATTIADYEPQQSFMDIQAGGERITKQGGKTVTDTTRGIKDGKIDGKPLRSSTPTPKSVSQLTGLSPEDLKGISYVIGGSYSGTTGKTNPKTTLSNPPKSGVDKATLEKNIEASLKQLEIDNEQLKGDALKRNIGLAADLGLDILTAVTMLTPIPGDEAAAIAVQASKAGVKTGAKTMAQQRTIDAFRTQVTDPKNLSRAQDVISRAPKAFKKDVAIPIKVQGKTINVKANEILRNKGFKVDSYQPQGKVLSEKKRLKSPKDLADKIPGYYDGKPAPLGFPIVEPPKMKNGMHPDLVDGKKTAKRFNRLDPISARAMPKTGNSHIDKKVRAAAKKPK